MNGIITFINEACDPEAGPHPTMLRPWSQTCSLQNWEQDICVVLKPPVHGIYWEQYISVVLKPPVYGISFTAAGRTVAISGGFHFLYV